ncbi:DUF1028 domain-containing protein [Candidatus Poribacteria bacterium]|nr:DUF1028 domain-containing protein [Candidatus Poribacteria bacterium]
MPIENPPVVATFSIVAYDPETNDLGVAVQSRFLAVGAVVPWAKAGVGAIATQASANTSYGPNGLKLLESGLSVQETLDKLVQADDDRAHRQVGIIDANGNAAAYTGTKTNAWAGHHIGKNYTAQGNILAGEKVVLAMGEAFEKTDGPLAEKLLAALEAGQAAGGDTRGQQSAALLVVRKNGGFGGFNDRYIDLRVDDHTKPIEELKRIYQLYERTFLH